MSSYRIVLDARRSQPRVLRDGSWLDRARLVPPKVKSKAAWLWHELTRKRGTLLTTWIIRGTGLIGLAGLILVLWLPATAPLVGLGIISLWLNGPLSMFFPTTLEPIVMLFGRVYEPLLVAAAATAGNIYVEFLNYHLYRKLLGLERLRSLRESWIVRLSVRLFRRMPFFTTWLCAWSVLPYWTVRLIAPMTDYPLRRYMTATLLGRFPKMWLFAALGIWLGLSADLLLSVTGACILVAVTVALVRHVIGRKRRALRPAVQAATQAPAPITSAVGLGTGLAARARTTDPRAGVAPGVTTGLPARLPAGVTTGAPAGFPASLPAGAPAGRIELLVDAPEFRGRLIRDLAAARKRAWLQVMTFEGDEAGRSIADALRACPAPDRRVIIDCYTRHFHSDRFVHAPRNLLDPVLRAERRSTAAMVDELRGAGVGVRFVGPVGLCFFQMPARQHKKIVVIDDDIAYMGGINFSDHNFAWHDLMLRIEHGGIAAFLGGDVDATWRGIAASSRASFEGVDLYSVSGVGNEATLEPILDLIRHARESVIVHSAYITFPYCEALREARRRGVKVTVLTPEANNRGLLRSYILRETERSGFELRFSRERMSHLKAILVDDRWLITGSANFDWLAHKYHAELLAVISRPEVIAEFQSRVLGPDLAESVPAASLGADILGRAVARRGRNAERLLHLMSHASRVLCRSHARSRGKRDLLPKEAVMKTKLQPRASATRTAAALLAFGALWVASASAQSAVGATELDLSEVEWRLPVGEVLEYGVDLAGRFKLGRGTLAIEGLETVQGRPTYRVAMQVELGALFFKLKDRRVSWIEAGPLRSLRFEQSVEEGKHRRRHRILLDPLTRTYRGEEWNEEAGAFVSSEEGRTPAAAAQVFDELAFLYLLRLIPVEKGRYSLDGYFRAEENPIELRVVGRERVRVPAGRFSTLVLAPVIPGRNLLAPERDVRVYLSDDDRRLIVMMTSVTPAGEARLYLRRHEVGEIPVALATN